MVGLEACQLQIAIDAVAAVQRVDRVHELVLVGGAGGITPSSVDVTQEGDPRRERKTGHERREEVGGAVDVTAPCQHARQPVLGHAVVGGVGQRAPVRRLGQIQVAGAEVEVADERAHVGGIGR